MNGAWKRMEYIGLEMADPGPGVHRLLGCRILRDDPPRGVEALTRVTVGG
jgi:hypothetical protein